MKKISGIVLMTVVLFCATASAGTKEDIKALNLAGVETLLQSDSLECRLKQDVSRQMSITALQELFQRFEQVENTVAYSKAMRVNDLMNTVFAEEGHHPWNKNDMRVLYIIRASWEQSIDPGCFKEKIDGFSSEEWLEGASWAMRQKK